MWSKPGYILKGKQTRFACQMWGLRREESGKTPKVLNLSPQRRMMPLPEAGEKLRASCWLAGEGECRGESGSQQLSLGRGKSKISN